MLQPTDVEKNDKQKREVAKARKMKPKSQRPDDAVKRYAC